MLTHHNAASFSQLAPLLTDYQVIAIDMAGHGHFDYLTPSAKPPPKAVRIAKAMPLQEL